MNCFEFRKTLILKEFEKFEFVWLGFYSSKVVIEKEVYIYLNIISPQFISVRACCREVDVLDVFKYVVRERVVANHVRSSCRKLCIR